MEIPFAFEPILVFGCLSIFLLIGVVLRAKIAFFQKFLFPSCLIGGLLGLILISVGLIDLPIPIFETFAYHFFVLSFISVGLTGGGGQDRPEAGHRALLKGPLWMALIEGVTISAQAVCGCLLVLLFGFLGWDLFPTFGLLVPLGFTEGPGQALSIGKVWEGFGFAHAATIGLTFAAIGFLFAFFVGVPLVNWGIRRGLPVHSPGTLPRDLLVGVIPGDQDKEPAGHLTMHSGNIDTLAFQMALVGLVYVVTYVFVILLARLLPPDVGKTLWGFFFFFGMFFGLVIRWLMGRFGVAHLIDPGIQRRITGWAVDFLIVSTVMAVQLVIVWQFIVPILVMSLTGGVVTTFLVIYFGKRISDLNLERTVSIYGTCTGTVSSGLLLLRIADPDFRTPVALEIGLMNILVVPIILGAMILVNAPVWWGWSVGLTALVFLGLFILCLALLRILNYWGRPKF